MASMKNEHIVWAYGDREDGQGQAVIVGLTEQGLKYLLNSPGMTFKIDPPGTHSRTCHSTITSVQHGWRSGSNEMR